MIKIETISTVVKTVIIEKEVIDKLHKFTEENNIESFIKTFMDWMFDNNIRFGSSCFYLNSPQYEDDNNLSKYIELEGYDNTKGYTYNLTGLNERSFADWIYVNEKDKEFYTYKGYLIKPTFIADNNSRRAPQFVIYYPKEVKEIK